jgi:hypothetical protein
MGSDAPGNYARHNRVPSPDRGYNRLQVFRHVEAARLGHRVCQELQRRAVPSEKCAARSGGLEDEMPMMDACFAACFLGISGRGYKHYSLYFNRLWELEKLATSSQVKDAMVAQFALRPALGHREVWQDKCDELGFGELDGDRRRCKFCCHYAHHARTSCEGYCRALSNQIFPYSTRG